MMIITITKCVITVCDYCVCRLSSSQLSVPVPVNILNRKISISEKCVLCGMLLRLLTGAEETQFVLLLNHTVTLVLDCLTELLVLQPVVAVAR